MEALSALDGNGLKVASTFAGFGGSSLGYRFGGFEVVAAVEFDRVSSAVYEANASATAVVNPGGVGDVREIAGGLLREMAGGELDVLDGSPPCQGWSTAGNRDLDDENCHLYGEYVRLVGEAQPRALVAENVTGIVKGDARRRFLRFLAGFEAHGYRVAVRKLDASRLGVPQKRERIIVLGFRDDQGVDPADVFAAITPTTEPMAMRHALPDVDRLVRQAPPGGTGSYKYRTQRGYSRAFPAPTLCASGLDMSPPGWIRVETMDGGIRAVSIADLKALSGFPADFALPEDMTLARAWEGFGNSVPPPMARAWAEPVRDALLGAS
jgi:DNA (cytosine-5)-methyltransferase 1